MTVITPPLYLNIDSTYGAADLGLPYRDLIAEGVVGSGALEVTERGAGANMSVDVAAGVAWIAGDDSDLQPCYRCVNDGTVNLAIDAADGTNPRIDRVVAEVRDSVFSGVSNDWRLRVITGTPAGSPSAPATPDNAISLATVSVPASDTTIADAQITDTRPLGGLQSGLGVPLVTSLPAAPYDGQVVDYLADGANGVAWRLRYRLATTDWLYIGGPPLFDFVAAQEGTAATSYTALSTPGPEVALPLGGDYIVDIGCTAWATTAGQPHRMSYDIGGTGATDADGFFAQTGTGTNTAVTAERSLRLKTGLSAVTLTAKYKSTGGAATATFKDRYMSVTPVRLDG